MIKPFDVIEEQKKVIENLTYKLKYSKNQVKDTKDINTLIRTLKCFDSMLVSKYKTDAIDKLLYALFYEYALMYSNNRVDNVKEYYLTDLEGNRKLVKNENYGKKDGFPIHTIVEHIDEAIRYDKEFKKMQVISILKDYELEEKIKNNSVFDNNYTNFDLLLKRLVTEFKTSMLWTI